MPENEKKPKSHYIDKIRKLFALSESPVDAEAIAALTKARELMVKYKITKEDIADTDNSDITKAYMDNIQFHARKDIWINDILVITKRYFPVEICVSTFSGKKAKSPVVVGFPSDVEVAKMMIGYITDTVHALSTAYCKRHSIPKGQRQTNVKNGIGFGFALGWETALKEQEEKNPEWALVLTTPDVSEAINLKGQYKPQADGVRVNKDAFSEGMEAGYEYGTKKRLTAASNLLDNV